MLQREPFLSQTPFDSHRSHVACGPRSSPDASLCETLYARLERGPKMVDTLAHPRLSSSFFFFPTSLNLRPFTTHHLFLSLPPIAVCSSHRCRGRGGLSRLGTQCTCRQRVWRVQRMVVAAAHVGGRWLLDRHRAPGESLGSSLSLLSSFSLVLFLSCPLPCPLPLPSLCSLLTHCPGCSGPTVQIPHCHCRGCLGLAQRPLRTIPDQFAIALCFQQFLYPPISPLLPFCLL